MNFTYIKNAKPVLALALLSGFCMPSAANAQGLNNQAWSAPGQNRASIAALMYQVENDGSGSSASAVIAGGGGDVTQIICGSTDGDGNNTSSNAQANSSCIILNNSDGSFVDVDQDSEGDQNADADSNVEVEETIIADGVLEALEGGSVE